MDVDDSSDEGDTTDDEQTQQGEGQRGRAKGRSKPEVKVPYSVKVGETTITVKTGDITKEQVKCGMVSNICNSVCLYELSKQYREAHAVYN
jgi:hypothetical protein